MCYIKPHHQERKEGIFDDDDVEMEDCNVDLSQDESGRSVK